MSLQLNIPLVDGAPSPYFEAQYVLEGATYTLRFRWNARAEAWFLSLLDEGAETMLIADMKIVVSWPLNAYRSGNPLPGTIMFFDTTGEDRDPELTDLGVRVVAYYLTSEDLRG